MSVPCVAVERERGEAVRTRLADVGALDGDHEIEVVDDTIYVPVTEPDAVPGDLRESVVERELDERKRPRTPADILGYEPSLERLGDLVIIDEDDDERARAIADAVVASDVPCDTVLNRASPIEGDLRVRRWDVLAGNGTETVHREYGHEFRLDIAEVYFSPRLATERHRVIEQVEPGESVVDMFAGVGPFAIPMAMRGAEVIAVDINPRAIEYLKANAHTNGVEAELTPIEGDVRELAVEYVGWADRLVMNLPHRAHEFLETARELASDTCRLHYYDIQPKSDPFGHGEARIRDVFSPEYDIDIVTRREVRSYAPHEVNVCLDIDLTR